jgi:hypothetical protein
MCPPLALPATPPLQQGPCRQVHRRRGWHVAQPIGGGGEEREKSSIRIKNCLSEGIFLHLPTPTERETESPAVPIHTGIRDQSLGKSEDQPQRQRVRLAPP